MPGIEAIRAGKATFPLQKRMDPLDPRATTDPCPEHVRALVLPAARALLTRLALDPAAVPQTQAAFSDILAEWPTAGIAC